MIKVWSFKMDKTLLKQLLSLDLPIPVKDRLLRTVTQPQTIPTVINLVYQAVNKSDRAYAKAIGSVALQAA